MYDTLVRNKKTEIEVKKKTRKKTKELHYIQKTNNNNSLLRSNGLKTENGREQNKLVNRVIRLKLSYFHCNTKQRLKKTEKLEDS